MRSSPLQELSTRWTESIEPHPRGGSDAKGNVYGGHLSHGIIGATCEMVITVIDGVVDRVKDEETGLNVLTLSVKVQKGNCSAGLRVTVKVLNRYIFL